MSHLQTLSYLSCCGHRREGRNVRGKLPSIDLLPCFARPGCHTDGYEELPDRKDLGPIPGSCGAQLHQPSTMHNIYIIQNT